MPLYKHWVNCNNIKKQCCYPVNYNLSLFLLCSFVSVGVVRLTKTVLFFPFNLPGLFLHFVLLCQAYKKQYNRVLYLTNSAFFPLFRQASFCLPGTPVLEIGSAASRLHCFSLIKCILHETGVKDDRTVWMSNPGNDHPHSLGSSWGTPGAPGLPLPLNWTRSRLLRGLPWQPSCHCPSGTARPSHVSVSVNARLIRFHHASDSKSRLNENSFSLTYIDYQASGDTTYPLSRTLPKRVVSKEVRSKFIRDIQNKSFTKLFRLS